MFSYCTIVTILIHVLCGYRSGVFDDDKCVPGNAHAMNIVGYGWGYWKFNVPLYKWEWQYVDYWVNMKITLLAHSESN